MRVRRITTALVVVAVFAHAFAFRRRAFVIPFGIALAWLRDRTDSAVPGMFVHGLFNAAALIAIVLGS